MRRRPHPRKAEAPEVAPGSGKCPRCGSCAVRRVENLPMQKFGAFYATTLELCRNPACHAAWEPFDVAQLLDPDEPKTSCFIEPCDNCAFRPGSVEQRDPERWRDLMTNLGADGAGFYCHKGVPLDPAGEHGFAYPEVKSGRDLRKLRRCRGWLSMLGRRWDKERKQEQAP